MLSASAAMGYHGQEVDAGRTEFPLQQELQAARALSRAG